MLTADTHARRASTEADALVMTGRGLIPNLEPTVSPAHYSNAPEGLSLADRLLWAVESGRSLFEATVVEPMEEDFMRVFGVTGPQVGYVAFSSGMVGMNDIDHHVLSLSKPANELDSFHAVLRSGVMYSAGGEWRTDYHTYYETDVTGSGTLAVSSTLVYAELEAFQEGLL